MKDEEQIRRQVSRGIKDAEGSAALSRIVMLTGTIGSLVIAWKVAVAMNSGWAFFITSGACFSATLFVGMFALRMD